MRWLIGAEVREECAVGTGEGASPKENRVDGASGLKQTPLRIQESRCSISTKPIQLTEPEWQRD